MPFGKNKPTEDRKQRQLEEVGHSLFDCDGPLTTQVLAAIDAWTVGSDKEMNKLGQDRHKQGGVHQVQLTQDVRI